MNKNNSSPMSGFSAHIVSGLPTKEYPESDLAANPMGSNFHNGQLPSVPEVVPPDIDLYGDDACEDCQG